MSQGYSWKRAVEALPFLFRRGFPSRRELDAFQDRRLRLLVEHGYARVPLLRRRWEAAGVVPGSFRGREDLSRLPLFEKRDYQLSWAKTLSTDPSERVLARRTSGSTGRPLSVVCTAVEDRLLSLFRWRSMLRMGVRWNDRVAALRPPKILPLVPRFWRLAMVPSVRLGLPGLYHLDVTREPEELAALLHRLQPDVVAGHSALLSEIGKLLPAYPMRPRLLVVGGMKVLPGVRRRLCHTYGCPVRETYGCHEFGVIAWQCPETGLLHLSEETLIPEILQEDGSSAGVGEAGEFVGTALHSFFQPYVRYRLEDRVIAGPTPCPCGAPYRTLVSVEGRLVDRLLTVAGQSISGVGILENVGDCFPWIQQFQLVQETFEEVTLRYVASSPPNPDQARQLEGFLAGSLGKWFRTRAILVNEIPRDADGKFRLVRSLPREKAGEAPGGGAEAPPSRGD